MKFNSVLARQALEAIKANPAGWVQEDWRCGTGMCFAGYVAHAAGARWLIADFDAAQSVAEDLTMVAANGEEKSVLGLACDELGYAGWLRGDGFIPKIFGPHNTIEDIENYIEIEESK